MTAETATRLPGAAKLGFATAVILAAVYLVASLWNPFVAIPPALVFLIAGFGIRRGNRWSAYGPALFLLSIGAGMAFTAVRFPSPEVPWSAILTVEAMVAIAAGLLFRAGRSLPPRAASGRRAIWIALAAATALHLWILRPFVIPTGAMEDTIRRGDYLLVRVAGSLAPARGDIVVLRYPVDRRQTFVKRIVAVGGDRLRIVDKQLFVNGAPLTEPYVSRKTEFVDNFRDNFPREPNVAMPGSWAAELPAHVADGLLVVPPGKFFVLGDNRDASLDSRYWGFIDRADIVGKPLLIYFSADQSTEELASPTQLQPPILLTPNRIRWRRIFKPI